jgi:hypothetical protein
LNLKLVDDSNPAGADALTPVSLGGGPMVGGATLIERIAVIGSFKQHYEPVRDAISAFRSAGLTVTSPAGSNIVQPDIDFVRFSTDPDSDSDELVQSKTLANIFSADLTYVVAPFGYVGRTTCYEIGRLVQARKPIYFSDVPEDLPIHVAPEFISPPDDLISRFRRGGLPRPLFEDSLDEICEIERRLIYGR